MKLALVGLLCATALAGCTVNSGVETTPTFAPARMVPLTIDDLRARQKEDAARRDNGSAWNLDQNAPGALPTAGVSMASAPAPSKTGVAAIAEANRAATVEPTSSSMQGATWVIETVDPRLIYRINTAPARVTTILLPAGERFNGAVGGDVESFLVNVAYAGPRPAVSILPKSGRSKGNLQLVTTGGFYSFDLVVSKWAALNLVDIGRQSGVRGNGRLIDIPQPEGDFTRLSITSPQGHRPAWSPAEAWADSYKMVIRFTGPLPVLPTLSAGSKGEQIVSYHVVNGPDGAPYIVTSRRVTEAHLKLDSESVVLTVDPAAISSGSGADPTQGADGWRTSEALPDKPPAPANSNVAVFVVQPGQLGTMPAGTFAPAGPSVFTTGPTPAVAAPAPAQQPMANGLVSTGGI